MTHLQITNTCRGLTDFRISPFATLKDGDVFDYPYGYTSLWMKIGGRAVVRLLDGKICSIRGTEMVVMCYGKLDWIYQSGPSKMMR